MSERDEELERLRQKRLAEMQAQAAQQQADNEQINTQQRAAYEDQKEALIQRILSSEARARLTNLKMARPEFAENIELQLIQLAQSGTLRGKMPLTDELFKNILRQLQEKTKKRDTQIRIL
jgi:programmed cell death protein 5